jgi:ABC-type transporter Mla MlaB component
MADKNNNTIDTEPDEAFELILGDIDENPLLPTPARAAPEPEPEELPVPEPALEEPAEASEAGDVSEPEEPAEPAEAEEPTQAEEIPEPEQEPALSAGLDAHEMAGIDPSDLSMETLFGETDAEGVEPEEGAGDVEPGAIVERWESDWLVLDVRDDLVGETTAELFDRAREVKAEGVLKLRLDLSGVEEVDAAALSVLVLLARSMAKAGGGRVMELAGLGERVGLLVAKAGLARHRSLTVAGER